MTRTADRKELINRLCRKAGVYRTAKIEDRLTKEELIHILSYVHNQELLIDDYQKRVRELESLPLRRKQCD